MTGGKRTWVEVETRCPNDLNNNPSKGGMSSKTAMQLSGKEALRVGKINKTIAAKRGYKL